MSAKLTPGGLRRIAAATERNERAPRNRVPDPPRRAAAAWNPGTKRFVITTTIAARTSATVPSSGTATLSDWDYTAKAWVNPRTVTLYNDFKDAIPANAHGMAAWIGGDWFAQTWNCTGG